MEANPVLFILAVVFVSMVGLFGLGILFVRGENIERNVLVGSLTVLTALLAGLMLATLPPGGQATSTLISISLVSLVGYGIGRVIDAILGPRDHTDAGTLGADLSD